MFQALNAVFSHPNYKSSHKKHILTEEDIEALNEIVVVLNYFYDATEQLSGKKYATISQVLPIFWSLSISMKPKTTDSKLTYILKQCLHYYTEFYLKKWILPNEAWYCAASFLDGRFKSFMRLTPTVGEQKKKLAMKL